MGARGPRRRRPTVAVGRRAADAGPRRLRHGGHGLSGARPTARARSARSTSQATSGSGRRARSARIPTSQATDGRRARRPSRGSSAEAPSSTVQARSGAPPGTASCPARSTTTSAFGSRQARTPTCSSTSTSSTCPMARWCSGTTQRQPEGPRPRREPAARGRRRSGVALGDRRHERAVRRVRARDGAFRSAPLARGSCPRRARAASRHLRRLVRRDRLLSLGRGAPADRGRVGESGARGRRPGLSLGRRRAVARFRPRDVRCRAEARPNVSGRRPLPGERARTVSRTWPATSGNG